MSGCTYLWSDNNNKRKSDQNDMGEKIELVITCWTLQTGQLFQFQSEQHKEREQFRSTRFCLPLPKLSQQPIYYFFHLLKGKHRDQKLTYYLQRRDRLVSNISDHEENINNLRLMGGVKLFWKQIHRRDFLFAQPIKATDIQRVKINGKWENVEFFDPFAIVRTFNKGYPIREGQIMRFGKLQYEVKEVNTEFKKEVDYGKESDKVLNLDQTKQISCMNTDKEDSHQSKSLPQCRVCLMSEEEAGDILLSPCLCSGTGQYIHLQCLKEWIQQKLKKMRVGDGALYETSLLFCEICKQKFPKAVIKNGKTFGLLKFLEDSEPYIALKSKKEIEQNMFYISFQGAQQVKVGRLNDNGVVLDEQSVSRKHAVIKLYRHQECEKDNDKKNEKIEIRIQDESSKYGTLVKEKGMSFRVGSQLKAFQIANTVFSLKLIREKY